jgi:hypothetical protein
MLNIFGFFLADVGNLGEIFCIIGILSRISVLSVKMGEIILFSAIYSAQGWPLWQCGNCHEALF